MNSISFANPYLLFMMIPLIIFFVVPFFISITKRGFSWHNLTSMGIHVAICVLVTFAASDITTSTPAKTSEIYIVADVSESINDKYDLIDQYIDEIHSENKDKADIGIVCFGKDQQTLVSAGSSLKSVRRNKVDRSATDIASALTYTSSLFTPETNKRMVLISDAKETDCSAIDVASTLYSMDIQLDCIYIDDEFTSPEVQINSAECDESTLQGVKKTAKIAVQSNCSASATLSLYEDDVLLSNQEFITSAGFDYRTFDLDSDHVGTHTYKAVVKSVSDKIDDNNEFFFTQEVVAKRNILIIGGSNENISSAKKLYQNYQVTAYLDSDSFPKTIDYLAQYDEIVLSDADLYRMSDSESFVSSLQNAVVNYGKSLNVLGCSASYPKDTYFDSYYSMMPVNFDLQSNITALVLVIDCSMSMQNNSRLDMAKKGAIQCLDLLGEDDYISVIAFSTNTKVVVPLTRLYDKEAVKTKINSITNSIGTNMAAALKAAYNQISGMEFDSKQVLLLSDGVPTDSGQVEQAKKLLEDGITTSVINIQSSEGASLMKSIASAGNGNYYYISNTSDLPSIMLNEVDTGVTSTKIEQTCETYINKPNDSMVSGIESLPATEGFTFTNPKYSATTLLNAKFTNENDVAKEGPLLAYWEYGKGKVSLFTSSLSSYASAWMEDESSIKVLSNLISWSDPQYHMRTAFHMDSSTNGYTHTLSLSYDDMNRNMEFSSVSIKSPGGKSIDAQFVLKDGAYTSTFVTDETGSYTLSMTYSYNGNSYSFQQVFSHSYSKEYNMFETDDSYILYNLVADHGSVLKDASEFQLEDVEFEISEMSWNLPLLIIALVLFVIDIGIRKLKLADIKQFFKRKKKEKAQISVK